MTSVSLFSGVEDSTVGPVSSISMLKVLDWADSGSLIPSFSPYTRQ